MRQRGLLVVILFWVLLGATASGAPIDGWEEVRVRVVQVEYRTHDGHRRAALVVLPDWYGPHNNPRLPLIISPHGRGVHASENVQRWGNLPALGGFAVVNPEGHGRRLARFSWGYRGQIKDLARMPSILKRRLPWLRIDKKRIYAFGASMGGQETLLLVARHPRLLAGAAAFDAVTDFARRYRDFTRLGCNEQCRLRWRALGPRCAAWPGVRWAGRLAASRAPMRLEVRSAMRARSRSPASHCNSGGAGGTASSPRGTNRSRSHARSGG